MSDFEKRFERQTRFAPLGRGGQAALEAKSTLLVGCGALGGAIAQSLVRSGIGRLVIVDRDLVETSNLARQVLFEERHALAALPKVDAARESLARIGGPTRVEAHAEHLDANNIGALASGVDLVLDGTDNLATRYLVNDYCVEHELPWIYGGVVGASGVVLAILPGRGPCLRCLFPEPPPPASLPTCETAGVLQPAVGAIASMQAGLALRVLGADARFEPELIELDAWNGRARSVRIARDPSCPCCGAREFPFLHHAIEREAVLLCGRDTVQVRGRARADLELLERDLNGVAHAMQRNGSLLRFEVGAQRFTVFADGRALIEGLVDVGRARALYDRYIGA